MKPGTLFKLGQLVLGVLLSGISQPSAQAWAQIHGSSTYCMSGWCSRSVPGLPGPYTQTPDPRLNAGLGKSWKSGSPVPLNEVLRQIQTGAQAGSPGLTSQQAQQFRELLNRSTETLGTSLLAPMPLPASVPKAYADQWLEPIWEAQGATPQNPLQIMDRVDDAVQETARVAQKQGPRNERATYLWSELQRVHLNENGVAANLPFARVPSAPLLTLPLSSVGMELRGQLNTVLAAESVVGVRCADPEVESGGRAGCQSFIHYTDGIKTGIYLADRLYMAGEDEAYSSVMQSVRKGVSIARSFAEGLLKGGSGIVIGSAMIALAPELALPMLAYGIYEGVSALVQYDETFERLQGKWNSFLTASDEERSRMLGEATAFLAGAVFGGKVQAGIDSMALREGVELLLTRSAVRVATRAKASEGLAILNRVLPNAAKSVVLFERPEAYAALAKVDSVVAKGWTRLAQEGGESLAVRVFNEAPEASVRLGRLLAETKDPHVTQHLVKAARVRIENSNTGRKEQAYAAGEFEEIAHQFIQMHARVADVPVVGWAGNVTRAVPRTYQDENGVTRWLGTEDVMKFHPGQWETSNRVDMNGNRSVSTAIGSDARETIVAELKTNSADVKVTHLFYEESRSFKKVWDFRAREVQEAFKIDQPQLMQKTTDPDWEAARRAYILTNIIGDLARIHKIDAVILRSAMRREGFNLFIIGH